MENAVNALLTTGAEENCQHVISQKKQKKLITAQYRILLV